MQNGFRQNLAGNRCGVEPMATKGGDVPDIGLQLADLRHQVAGIGHQARPSEIGLQGGKLGVDIQHRAAQFGRDPLGAGRPCCDAPAPKQTLAAINQAVVI